ncbi:MAG: SPASM domain-containing protein [Haliscomenobacter sp.]|uniref:SPASM domain-containing protein n=1 Tax=Haliscomenobacter sp. TaxID=2717303 RepID=UPI0029BF3604|nr:SPASM domain-containing protein [Haliscomenobacter sp.]MDX2067225.1 SPASM domain-containing protein [Haliscomenobacter sp.]
MLKITPRKIWNATKVLSSYYLSRLLQKPIQWGVPFSISIEPTTACNLRCPECPSGLRAFSRPTGNLRSDFFRKTIDELHRDLSILIFYFQGEPYINPDFLNMVQYASQRGIYTITSTNGHFLNEENARKTIESGLDRLIISVDGSTQEVYEQYRKSGHLEVVLQGARNVVKWKKKLKSKTPHLIFQFLVVRPNEHQIPEIYKLAKEIGIDEVRLKTAQIYDYAQGNPLIPEQDRYSRYRRQADGSYRIKNQLLNHCWKLWHACVITWDGMVVPCCFDKDAQYRMGNLQEQPLRELWQQQPYREFRQQLLKGRDKIDICTNCTEGCKIWG